MTNENDNYFTFIKLETFYNKRKDEIRSDMNKINKFIRKYRYNILFILLLFILLELADLPSIIYIITATCTKYNAHKNTIQSGGGEGNSNGNNGDNKRKPTNIPDPKQLGIPNESQPAKKPSSSGGDNKKKSTNMPDPKQLGIPNESQSAKKPSSSEHATAKKARSESQHAYGSKLSAKAKSTFTTEGMYKTISGKSAANYGPKHLWDLFKKSFYIVGVIFFIIGIISLPILVVLILTYFVIKYLIAKITNL